MHITLKSKLKINPSTEVGDQYSPTASSMVETSGLIIVDTTSLGLYLVAKAAFTMTGLLRMDPRVIVSLNFSV